MARKLIIGSGVVLLVIVAALAVFLVPPHLQVRGVAPALPSVAALRALANTPGGPVAVHYVVTSHQQTAQGVLGHDVFLIEWPDGGLFMIDAGMDRETATAFGETVQTLFGGDAAVVDGTAAELIGNRIQRVRGVGFTHLHIDHTQGLIGFCAARGSGSAPVLLQTAYQRDLHNFNTTEGAAIVAASCLQREDVPADGLSTFDRFPGLGMVPLGGHTPGSTLFAVGVGGRLLLFSGDITNSLADLRADRGKGFLYSVLFVPEHTGRTAELRRWLADLDRDPDIDVVVSHDLDNVQRVLAPFDGWVKEAQEAE
jgi:glyoxylase-like metal-dependent hydrolase (beta-lactamase superfamily II)